MFCDSAFIYSSITVPLQHPDPKEMQMNLTGFLHSKYARIFIQELWDLLLSAQENVGGIPTKFVEQKKEEIRLKKVVEEKRAPNGKTLTWQGEMVVQYLVLVT